MRLLLDPVFTVYSKGLGHDDFAVLGQLWLKSLASAFIRAKNASVAL